MVRQRQFPSKQTRRPSGCSETRGKSQFEKTEGEKGKERKEGGWLATVGLDCGW